MKEYCFVIQPYDGGDFDNRFDDIIKPAVEDCGLTAYRVDRDPYVEIAVSAIEEKIRDATIVVAEISIDNPNVWFELGYAMALDKKIIMLCDATRRLNGFPFDISHRNILLYRTGSMRDFLECQNKLKVRINAKLHGIRLAQIDDSILLFRKYIFPDQKEKTQIILSKKQRNGDSKVLVNSAFYYLHFFYIIEL